MSALRLRVIDATIIADHTRLTANDSCYFLFEYTSRQNYAFSETNGLINNLKKKPSQYRGTAAWKYKVGAIQQCSTQMHQALAGEWLATATLVPVPPSKAADHPDFDDRMEQICRGMGADLDVRTIIRQRTSMAAAHEKGGGERPSVADLVAAYEIDEALTHPVAAIGIVDDVLTAGTHFKAMQHCLSVRFPDAPIYGFFVARRIFPAPTLPDVE